MAGWQNRRRKRTGHPELLHFAEIKPAVNQVETHVFQQQKVAKEYMQKYGKTAAQTALRFLMQSDVVVIPKSVHKDRMVQKACFSLIMIQRPWSGLCPFCKKCK